MTNTELKKIVKSLGMSGNDWEPTVGLAINGDVNAAIEICSEVLPKYEWTLKSRRACLRHPQTPDLDIDWTRGNNTGEALLNAILKE